MSSERWVRESQTSVPHTLLVRQRIGDYDGPWLAVHGFVKAEDRILGREAWAFISALVAPKHSESQLIAALNTGTRPWSVSHVPSDYCTFAGEIPWHKNFAAEVFSESGSKRAYREEVVLLGADTVEIEVLAHSYAWESYHSEINNVGSALVPSRCFSSQFDLRSSPQSFDQFLPDRTRATITLRGIDGLDGDILYVREDLLRQYVGERVIIWFAFGERDLCPYPPSPPQWLHDAQTAQANLWYTVLTEADLKQQNSKSPVD
jgi:hypothetical protein